MRRQLGHAQAELKQLESSPLKEELETESLALKHRIRELEDELGGLPVGKESGLARRTIRREGAEEVLRRRRLDAKAAVAVVAERIEEAECGSVERLTSTVSPVRLTG